ncbi:Zn-dependent protease [Flavobacterium pectinovorum]|uniref:Zn-dependent protease n=1 Tax=Flavobacterium pectinovorum TaxID=29533 RepID=A0A502EG85_9FLAO|nr:Zn-dependent protease [Flavobacterium pectinovorum]TPG35496.1 Zn-dependent protease [Flavobacterium pectinovorum]
MKNYILILILVLISCTNEKKVQQKIIVIQPLGNFKIEQAKSIFNKIKTINPNVVLRENIPFPKNSYYESRNRYRADTIIKTIKNNIGKDSVIVGLSNNDISVTKGKVKDWGVMGLGYHPGKACVVSDFRMSKQNKSQQFYKVVLHELGHTEGLPHCPVKSCLMRDAEGKNHLDEETAFCIKCKTYLIAKGWNLKNSNSVF